MTDRHSPVPSAGFRLPEDTVPHDRTFMQWPVNRQVHGNRALADLQASVARIANTIAAFEPVVMLADGAQHGAIRRQVSGAVDLWDISTDDLWCRDSGPTFVVDGAGGLAVMQFDFNGWGNRQVHANDSRIAARVAGRLGLPLVASGLVGEAGGVETDGHGTLLAHESSWVNPNRNRGTRAEITARLLTATGATRMIWAPGIIGADITDFHIDALARFVKPGQVVIQLGRQMDPLDRWSVAAFETRDILSAATDARGQQLDLVILAEPRDTRVRSRNFVASYVNFHVCNGAVIAAEFGDPDTDAAAAATLASLYPGRQIVMLNVDPLGKAGGGIHCATSHQPRV